MGNNTEPLGFVRGMVHSSSYVNLVFGTAVMGINLVIDLVYAVLDPRVRYQ